MNRTIGCLMLTLALWACNLAEVQTAGCSSETQSKCKGTIMGRTANASGAALRDAEATLLEKSAGSSEYDSYVDKVFTSEDGTFTFKNVKPGKYLVKMAKGSLKGSVEAELAGGGNLDLGTMKLSDSGIIAGLAGKRGE